MSYNDIRMSNMNILPDAPGARNLIADSIRDVPAHYGLWMKIVYGPLKLRQSMLRVQLPNPVVFYGLHGRSAIEALGRRIPLAAGAFVWLDGDVTYTIRADDSRNLELAIIRYGLLEAQTGRRLERPSSHRMFAVPIRDAVVMDTLMRDLFRTWTDEHSKALGLGASSSILHSLLLRVMEEIRLGRSSQGHEHKIEELRRRLDAEPHSRAKIEELAGALGISPRHFIRLFKKQTGLTPGAYQIQARLRRARYLIEEGRMTVKQCAYALGYPDPFVFSKQYRKAFGHSPSALIAGS